MYKKPYRISVCSKYAGIFFFIFLSLFIINSTAKAQNPDQNIKVEKNRLSVYAGMGLGYTLTPSFNDLVRNEVFGGARDSVKSFSVGLEVFGGMEYELSRTFSLRFDYSYFFKSKTYYNYFTTFDYFYYIHQPFIIGSYVIRGINYRFKIGAGFGYHFAQLQKSIYGAQANNYNSHGPAVRGEILFSTKISPRLDTYLSGFISGSFFNSFHVNTGSSTQNVNLSGFGVGVRLGLLINIL